MTPARPDQASRRARGRQGRAAFGGGPGQCPRPSLTAAARGARLVSGRDGETPLRRTEKHHRSSGQRDARGKHRPISRHNGLARQATDGAIDRSKTRDNPWDPVAHDTAPLFGTRVAEPILASGHARPHPTGRTYGCKRSNASTRHRSCKRGPSTYGIPHLTWPLRPRGAERKCFGWVGVNASRSNPLDTAKPGPHRGAHESVSVEPPARR
jgi:hypothetical protein